MARNRKLSVWWKFWILNLVAFPRGLKGLEGNRAIWSRQDILPHFLLKPKEEEKGGSVSPLASYQLLLMFRSVICRLSPRTVIFPFPLPELLFYTSEVPAFIWLLINLHTFYQRKKKREGECLPVHGINRFWRLGKSFAVWVREQYLAHQSI